MNSTELKLYAKIYKKEEEYIKILEEEVDYIKCSMDGSNIEDDIMIKFRSTNSTRKRPKDRSLIKTALDAITTYYKTLIQSAKSRIDELEKEFRDI